MEDSGSDSEREESDEETREKEANSPGNGRIIVLSLKLLLFG